jgi:hypothetical protein
MGKYMQFRQRHNLLLSQRLDVALVYKEMLGINEARTYLARENMPEHIAERVLSSGRRRHIFDTKLTSASTSLVNLGCRRRNHIHDAIIEAALKIEEKLGEKWARVLLSNENVSYEISERVLGRGPRQVRAKFLDTSVSAANKDNHSSVEIIINAVV